MEIVRVNENNVTQVIQDFIKEQREGLVYLVPQKTIAFVGYKRMVQDDVLEKNGVLKLELNNEGGVIVSGVGSLAIGYFSKNTKNQFNRFFSVGLKDYLQERGMRIVFSGNDLLIDGIYKCASCSSRRFGNILFSAFHISYDVDLGLINEICEKKMEKIPKGLKDYGITQEEIESFFLLRYKDFLKEENRL